MNSREYFDNSSRDANYHAQASLDRLPNTKQNTVEANNTLDLIIISAIAFVAMFYVVWQLCLRKASSNLPKISQSSNETNCTKCHFYDSNSYLKCAVHPTKVLKKEARECIDYESKQEDI